MYGCHTTEPDNPRSRATPQRVQDGYRVMQRGEIVTREPVIRRIESTWLPIHCGHLLRGTDPECTGCTNRGDDR